MSEIDRKNLNERNFRLLIDMQKNNLCNYDEFSKKWIFR